jgi:DNA-binding NarL/FixJ family response regulator
MREGIRALLQDHFTVVGEASNGREAVELAERQRPDVLVLEMMTPSMNGLEVMRQIRRREPQIRLVILSHYDDEYNVAQAVANGASAFILKQASSNDLVEAIMTVYRGGAYFSAPLGEEQIVLHLQQIKNAEVDPYETLTAREREVLQLVAEGHTSQQIGEMLVISPRTVEVHRTHLMRKLNLNTQTGLIRMAFKQGLVS